MVITTTDFPLAQSEWSAMATVLPALHSNYFFDTRSEYQGVSFIVPLLMLAPPLVWPVAQLSTRAQHMPLFGLPFHDRAVVLQVRGRYTFSPRTGLDSLIGEMSPYTTGDYFELPVSGIHGFHMTHVTFVCALIDSKTKTWLVLPLLSCWNRLNTPPAVFLESATVTQRYSRHSRASAANLASFKVA